MNNRVLVTGCNGFIGSHVTERLAHEGFIVCGIDNGPYCWEDGFRSLADSGRVDFLWGDITDNAFVYRAVERVKPGLVIHLASVVGVDRYIDDPLRVIDVNIIGLRNILKALEGSGARVVMASTSEIYGKNPSVPWSEDADRVLGPATVSRWSYSTSKAAAEHMLWAAAGKYAIEAVAVRFFNVYGPRQQPFLLVPAQIQRALKGEKLLVYDSGSQTRCFTYVDDIVNGVLAAAASPLAAGQAFNLGAEKESSVAEVTGLIAGITGCDASAMEYVNTREIYGSAYEDIPRRQPDTKKAQRLLGWRASTPLPDGLSETVSWWRKILSGI